MVCGYVHSGDQPPEQCPVCKAPKNMFTEIDENGNKIDTSAAKETETAAASPVNEIQPRTSMEKLTRFVLRNHLHPILVHTPNGIIPVIVLLLLLSNILHIQDLEKAAFFNCIFGLLAMPAVIFTGYLEWQHRYNKAKTILFSVKIICSLVVFASLLILTGWRLFYPDVATPASPIKWVYFSISLIMLAAAGLAGHLGGKLVFGSRDK